MKIAATVYPEPMRELRPNPFTNIFFDIRLEN